MLKDNRLNFVVATNELVSENFTTLNDKYVIII